MCRRCSATGARHDATPRPELPGEPGRVEGAWLAVEAALRGPTLFIFLPERLHELEFVRQQVPDGTLQEFYNERGELLFVVYESL